MTSKTHQLIPHIQQREAPPNLPPPNIKERQSEIVQVPHQRRLPPDYHLLLAKLEMQPGGPFKQDAAGKGKRSSLGQHVWQQPARLAGLRLDCAALAAALEKGVRI